MKFMAQKITDDEEELRSVHEFFFHPILRVDYKLTPNTTLRMGAQGFPFLKSQYWDFLKRDTDYTAQDYIISLSSVSSYSGYQLGLNAGYQLKLRRMKDRKRRFGDLDYTLFFIRLIVSLKPTTY
jgi:hypothetical protein